MAVTGKMKIPIFLRVGEGGEHKIGHVELTPQEAADERKLTMAVIGFFREAAELVETSPGLFEGDIPETPE